MRNRDVLPIVADAVSDHRSVDWSALQTSPLNSTQRRLLAQLRRISEANPSASRSEEPRMKRRWRGPLLLESIVALAAVKMVMATIATANAAAIADGKIPSGPLVCLSVFGVSAAVLLAGSATDVRARSLGVLFLVIAASFADPLLQTAGPWMAPVARMLRYVAVDAFLAYTFWRFAVCFPSATLTRAARRIAAVMLRVTAVCGAVLLFANAVPLLRSSAPLAASLPLITQLDRQQPEGHFWLVSFGLTIAGIPYLLWKSRFDASAERQRAGMFAGSLAASFAPMLVVVLLTPFVPWLQQPLTREVVAIFVYASLLSVVPLTVYSVRVNGVLKLNALVSRALQVTALRLTVWGACLMPLFLLAAYLYDNRDKTISAIVVNEWSVAVLALPALGALALSYRRQLVRAFDRRVLGDSPDLVEVVARLERGLHRTNGVLDVCDVLVRESDRSVHADLLTVLLVEQNLNALVSTAQVVPPLSMDSTLAGLLRVAEAGVHVGSNANGPVGRLLSDPERRWLGDHRIQFLLPLVRTDGRLLGAVAVGQKRNQLPLSRQDRTALSIIASRGAVVLENWLLRTARSTSTVTHAVGVDWTQEPAAYCERCRTMWPAPTAICSCGSKTLTAAVPLLVSGKFRVQRLLGSGGMGLVYLATDFTLDRRVVIKALPRLTPERRSRLQQEARAMAAASHPNLGMIYGVESWRGAPLLVMEFLEGDTLARLLRQRALSIHEVLELGIAMTDALDRIHASGILHRDIKPSNIGYTKEGVPKLFDFGIAHIRREPHHSDIRSWPSAKSSHASPFLRSEVSDCPARTTYDRIWGTPLYLSPEALAGADPTPLNDLWSLSLVLFEGLTRAHPFAAPTVTSTLARVRGAVVPDIRIQRPDCPPSLSDVFAHALSIERTRRPSSAGELRSWLRRIQAEIPKHGASDPLARTPARSAMHCDLPA